MLGVSIDSGAEFAEKLQQLVTGLPTTNWWSAAITAGSLVLLIGGHR